MFGPLGAGRSARVPVNEGHDLQVDMGVNGCPVSYQSDRGFNQVTEKLIHCNVLNSGNV